MKYYLGCDHAAFDAKEKLKSWLKKEGIEFQDMGTSSDERCDYPVYAKAVVAKVLESEDHRGILICGSGIGVSMVANRFCGIRAALCRSVEDATLSRQHNNANVICLGARISSTIMLETITSAWMSAEFEGSRHQFRIDQFNTLGEKL
jgi:ribose 5-phosphate isomerase B